MKYEAILFDLDGTLIDSAPDLIKTMNDVLTKYGRDECDEKEMRENVSLTSAVMLQIAFREDYPMEFQSLRQEFLSLYEQQNTVHTKLFDGVNELLSTLTEQDVPWAIVTNKLTQPTFPITEHFQLNQRASAIVCGDTLPVAKPDPSPLILACKMMGVTPENCVYVGDAISDIQAGKNAGMTTIGCTYGYVNPKIPVETWGADFIVDTPLDILSKIQ